MPRSAGAVRISFEAGTANFVADVTKAKSTVKDFGAGTRSAMVEANASVRILEGNMGSSTRVLSRFLVETLKLGPALKLAFPVAGAIFLADTVLQVSQRVRDFFKEIRNAPLEMDKAFRQAGAPMRAANDELELSTAKLENQLAKLEGRRQNVLKEVLLEAAKAADKLADSLLKDLDAIDKILKEKKVGVMRNLLGEAKIDDLDKVVDKLDSALFTLTEQFQEKYAKARAVGGKKGLDEIHALEVEENTRRSNLYEAALKDLKEIGGTVPTRAFMAGFSGSFHAQVLPKEDTTVRDKAIRDIERIWNEDLRAIKLTPLNEAAKAKVDEAAANKEAEKLTRPFTDKLKELEDHLAEAKSKLGAIGAGPEAEATMRAFKLAQESIRGVNKALEEYHLSLTLGQMAQIQNVAAATAAVEVETEWRSHLEDVTVKIKDQIRAQEMLTTAVGRGHAAVRAANVEAEVMKERGKLYGLGGEAGRAAEEELRVRLTAAALAKEQTAAAETNQTLGYQIGLANRLAEAHALGAAEIERINALEIIRAGIVRGASGLEIAQEVSKYYADRRSQAAADLATLHAEIAGNEKLAEAQLKGVEALRLQREENIRAEMVRLHPDTDVEAVRRKQEQEHQLITVGEVLRRTYNDQLEELQLQLKTLDDLIVKHGATLGLLAARKTLEDEILHTQAEQALKVGTLKDGLHAFFLDMKAQAKEPGQILYESMTSAIDQVSDEFSKLVTHQKTSFGKMFLGLGQQMVKESFKAEIQMELGKLGEKIFHKDITGRPVTFRPGDPGHVVVDNLPGGPGGSPGGGGGVGPGSGRGGGWGTIFGGATSNPYIFNFGGGRALGGDVAGGMGMAYEVGERGREWFFPGMSGAMLGAWAGRSGGGPGGGSGAFYHIDMRGATANPIEIDRRLHAALTAIHGSAVATSVQATADRMRRVPG